MTADAAKTLAPVRQSRAFEAWDKVRREFEAHTGLTVGNGPTFESAGRRRIPFLARAWSAAWGEWVIDPPWPDMAPVVYHALSSEDALRAYRELKQPTAPQKAERARTSARAAAKLRDALAGFDVECAVWLCTRAGVPWEKATALISVRDVLLTTEAAPAFDEAPHAATGRPPTTEPRTRYVMALALLRKPSGRPIALADAARLAWLFSDECRESDFPRFHAAVRKALPPRPAGRPARVVK